MKIAENPIEYHYPFYKIDDDRNRPSMVGSGVLLKVDNFSFILSAAHVLDGLNGKLSFPEEGVKESIPVDVTTTRIPSTGRKDDLLDVGIVHIPESVALLLEKRFRFLSSENLDTMDRWFDGKKYSFTGYPATKARVRHVDRAIDVDCYEFRLDGIQIESETRPWHPALHVAGVFRRDSMQKVGGGRITSPEPNGISGGGVWTRNENDGYKLVGIGTNWDARNQILVGVRIGAFMCFLRKLYPSIASKLPLDNQISIGFE